MDLLFSGSERIDPLKRALQAVVDDIRICQRCGHFAEENKEWPECCQNKQQDLLLVVESSSDVIALEKAGGFLGKYHVLGGHLSPLKGVKPSDLKIKELLMRVDEEGITEVILATSPTVEGDATALYISKNLPEDRDLKITRLGRGVPMGGSLEYTDSNTLRIALEGRQSLDH